jgi:hypothetical protein
VPPGGEGRPPGQGDDHWTDDPAPDWVVPGARITLYSTTATTLKENNPENPQIGVAGTSYEQYDIIEVTPAGVLMEVRLYTIPINQTRPQLTEVKLLLVDAASGGQLWVPRSELANPQLTTAEDANPKIETGSYQIEGETYDAIHFTKTERQIGDIIIRRVYDAHTGIMLFQSETSDNPQRRIIVSSEYRTYRAARLPWQGSAYTDQVRGFTRLVYDYTVTQRTPGFPDQHRRAEINYEIGQSTQTLLNVGMVFKRHVPRNAPPTSEDNPDPIPQTLSTNQRLGLYIAPDVLGRLENGQVLDEDPTVGYTIAVSNVYEVDGVTLVEITERGPGNSYTLTTTYDASVGLLVHAMHTVPGLDRTYERVLVRVE